MTELDGETNGQAGQIRRAPGSLRLPKANFAKVRAVVQAAQELNGPASAAVIADQMGLIAKGQSWSDRWSTVQYLGFLESIDGKFVVSELGSRFLSDDLDDAQRAAQEGLMRTGFRALLERFRTGTPSAKAMANVFVDSTVPEAAAAKSAALLIEMATECGMIVDGRFKPSVIEEIALAVPPAPGEDPRRRDRRRVPAGQTARRQNDSRRAAEEEAGTAAKPAASNRPSFVFNLNINVDPAASTPAEVSNFIRDVLAGM